MEECPFPNCPASDVAREQVRIQQAVSEDLGEIKANQKELIGEVKQVGQLLSDLNHLAETFRDFREQARKQFENLFARMTHVEQNKAELSDMKDMQKTGAGWLYDIAKVAIIGIVAFIAAKISIVTTIAQVSGK